MAEMPRQRSGEPDIRAMVREILYPLPPREEGWEETLRNRTREKVREWSCPSAYIKLLQQEVDSVRERFKGVLAAPCDVIANALFDAYLEECKKGPSGIPDTDPEINLDAEEGKQTDFETGDGGSI
jgi:hypothetical protein